MGAMRLPISPPRGGFRLVRDHARVFREPLLTAIGLSTALTLLFAYFYVSSRARSAELRRRWDEGAPAVSAEVIDTLGWRVNRQRYSATLIGYFAPSGRFMKRVLDADPGDRPLEVRVLPSDPTRAVVSWELDTGEETLQVVLAAGFSSLVGGIVAVWLILGRIRAITELARAGGLDRVTVLKSQDVERYGRVTRQMKLQHASGKPSKQSFPLAKGAPYYLDDEGSEVLALVDPLGRLHALRADGFPLAEIPGVALPSDDVAARRREVHELRWQLLWGVLGVLVFGFFGFIAPFTLFSPPPDEALLTRAVGAPSGVRRQDGEVRFELGGDTYGYAMKRGGGAAVMLALQYAGEVEVDYLASGAEPGGAGRQVFAIQADGAPVWTYAQVVAQARRGLPLMLPFFGGLALLCVVSFFYDLRRLRHRG